MTLASHTLAQAHPKMCAKDVPLRQRAKALRRSPPALPYAPRANRATSQRSQASWRGSPDVDEKPHM